MTNPVKQIEYCRATWEACSRQEWVHPFIHTLDILPRNWYSSVELQRETIVWEDIATSFTHTFSFNDEILMIDVALQVIRTNNFQDILVPMSSFPQRSTSIQDWMECYNVAGELDDDDPGGIHIPESEGSQTVEGLGLSNDKFLKPLITKKVNIGSPENPKFSNSGDYWDDNTVGKVTDLLHAFQDLLPTKLLEMKGIIGDLGEMKIPLKPDVNMLSSGHIDSI